MIQKQNEILVSKKQRTRKSKEQRQSTKTKHKDKKDKKGKNDKRTPAGRHAARITSLMLIAKFCTTSISISSDNALNICPIIDENNCCTCVLSPVALTQSIKLGVIALREMSEK